tara:strand:- start:188 stop:1033 length:846 start_codon:yes stop_codon:yes gene_type:complete
MNRISTSFAAFLLAGISTHAVADEPFALFAQAADDTRSMMMLDVDPTRPGKEVLGLRFDCIESPRNGQDHIRVTQRFRISAKALDNTTVFNPTALPSVTSGFFPDPSLARFQQGGPDETRYEASYEHLGYDYESYFRNEAPTPGSDFDYCSDYPTGDLFSVGAANSNGTRVIVIGLGLEGLFFNDDVGYEDSPDTNISRYSVTVYNNVLNSQRWSRNLPAYVGTFKLFPDFAMVGDFLGDDGNDEIRIAYLRGNANDSLTWQYRYYDVLNGNLITTATITE